MKKRVILFIALIVLIVCICLFLNNSKNKVIVDGKIKENGWQMEYEISQKKRNVLLLKTTVKNLTEETRTLENSGQNTVVNYYLLDAENKSIPIQSKATIETGGPFILPPKIFIKSRETFTDNREKHLKLEGSYDYYEGPIKIKIGSYDIDRKKIFEEVIIGEIKNGWFEKKEET